MSVQTKHSAADWGAGARKCWHGNVDIPVARITAKNFVDCSVTKGGFP